jgi:hypothetical protein
MTYLVVRLVVLSRRLLGGNSMLVVLRVLLLILHFDQRAVRMDVAMYTLLLSS